MFKKDGIKHVKTACMHPGVVRSEFTDKICIDRAWPRYIFCGILAPWMFWCKHACFKTPYGGAQTSLHTALCDFEKLESGAYYKDCVASQPTIWGNWQE